MLRGGVFIGVNRTGGGMPALHAAAAGAQKLYDWALDPNGGAMSSENVRLVSDAGDQIVTPDAVTSAVNAVVDQGVDQLLLYFSGHGLIINNYETWMLSEAPLRGEAAISVTRSWQAARFGKTPHVVIFSDACRTPARQIDTQSITAISAFRNEPAVGREKRVDVFYATAVGQAALEVNTVAAEGVFTEILYGALMGGAPEILEAAKEADDKAAYLWSGPLGKYLEGAVGDRLIALQINRDQAPQFNVQWGDENLHWLARFATVRAGGDHLDAPVFRRGDGPPRRGGGSRTQSQIAADLMATITTDPGAAREEIDRQIRDGADGADFFRAVAALDQSPPRVSGPTTPVIRVQGTKIQSVTASDVGLKNSGEIVSLDGAALSGASQAVVEFGNETATVLPILPGFVTDVTVDDQQIVAVSFESAATFPDALRAQLRLVRAVVAASVQRGRFHVADDGLEIGRLLQIPRGDDPALAVYAAYSFYELQANDRLIRSNERMLGQLGGSTLFDVGLLSGQLPDTDPVELANVKAVVPFYPLLTQGWELLDGFGVETSSLSSLKVRMVPSVWTVFRADARDELTQFLSHG